MSNSSNLESNQILDEAIILAQNSLTNFALGDSSYEEVEIAFGKNINTSESQSILQQWVVSDFSTFPSIEIVSAQTLNSNFAAYSDTTNTIYISEEFIESNIHNTQNIAQVLLEEIGHYVDSRLNAIDSSGDEGAIFSSLVLNQPLSQEQLTALRSEDDSRFISINEQVIEVEAASVSDSGGFEGSEQTIILESTEGGTAEFRYEHFTIPDNFIIRYEGRNLIETGFVGGSRTGEVEIPAGDSDRLEIFVTTNDEGTAWNYDVNVDVCPDSEPFSIEATNDEFEDADGDGDCEASGTVVVGRDDGTARLIRIEGTDAEYDENNLTTSNATVFAEIGGISEPLFTSNLEIPFGTGTSQVSDSGDAANDFTLAGLEVQFEEITVNRNDLGLKGRFSLPEEIGGIEIDSSLLGLDSIVVINQNGVRLGAAGTIELPDTPEFSFFNLFEVEAEDLSISYDDTINQLKLQGRVEFESFFRDTFIDEVKADFTGENFIQIQDGEPDFVGSLIVETELESRSGWGLSEAQIDINTIDNTIGGSAAITFPFRGRVPEGSIGLEFATSPFALNRAAIGADRLNVPVPSFPGVFFQRINGEVDNLAPSASDPITYTGGVGFSAGPNIAGNELLSFDLMVSLNESQLTGTGTVVLLDPLILQGQGQGILNWDEKFVEQRGSFTILDGLIQTSSGFKANSNFDIDFAGTASVNIPDSIPLFGGQEISSGNYLVDYNNNGTLSDDFAAAWGTVSVGAFGFEAEIVAGVKGFFDGRFERIGAQNIPSTNSFIVEPDTEWIILGADWENETTDDVLLNVETPDGTIISESDFGASNRIAVVDELSDSTTKVVIVFNPEPGVWDLAVQDSTGLGEIEYNAARDSVAPTIEVTEPSTNVDGGSVNIEFEAFDADSDAEVQLFYDDDNEGFDGLQIADGLAETDGSGSFVWDTTGVPTGEYFVYAVVMDENNIPAFSYSEGTVSITEAADLSVTQTIAPESIAFGSNYTYTVAVTNEGSANSTGVVLTETLPESVNLVSSSIAASTQNDNVLTFDIGNLDSGETRNIEIEVTAPLSPETLESEAQVSSQVFDPDASNDVDFATVTVSEAETLLPDLEVSRTDDSAEVALGEDFTYTLTVTNNGQGAANNINLDQFIPSSVNVVSSPFPAFNNTINGNLGTLQPGESTSVDFTVNSFAAGEIVSTVEVSSDEDDLNLANNSLIVSREVNSVVPLPADLELTQTVSNSEPEIGETVEITLTLTNNGPGVASGIEVTDLLPSELNFISVSAVQGSYDATTGIWDVGNVRDNLSRSLIITAAVESSGAITNTAEVTAVNEADPDSTPNNNNLSEDDQSEIVFNAGSTTDSTINGTEGDDNLSGTQDNDVINGLAGSDTINGRDGNDTLNGGNGNDLIDGGARDDILNGNNGDDTLLGGNGKDSLDGGVGNDSLDAGASDDELLGQDGDDTLLGGNGKDSLDGGVGNDSLDAGASDDELLGQAGDDTLLGNAGRDNLSGGIGNDLLDGGASNDQLFGQDGDDTLLGGVGADTLDGGIGSDLVTGGSSPDTFVISPGAGTDTITDFGTGNDVIGLSGGFTFADLSFAGNDIIFGDETLATLNGFDTTTLSEGQFVTI